MTLYCGIDLHSNNHVVVVIDEQDRRLVEKRLPNDLEATLRLLAPYAEELHGIAIESTFNWYWLVDGLMAHGYAVSLVNTPAAQKRYGDLKYSDDRHDAFWLAHLLRLGILPTGYIYPKAERGVRDLLRRRAGLVRVATDQHPEPDLAQQRGAHCQQQDQAGGLSAATRGPTRATGGQQWAGGVAFGPD